MAFHLQSAWPPASHDKAKHSRVLKNRNNSQTSYRPQRRRSKTQGTLRSPQRVTTFKNNYRQVIWRWTPGKRCLGRWGLTDSRSSSSPLPSAGQKRKGSLGLPWGRAPLPLLSLKYLKSMEQGLSRVSRSVTGVSCTPEESRSNKPHQHNDTLVPGIILYLWYQWCTKAAQGKASEGN